MKAIVLGAGGFIGGHLVTRLKKEGYWVRGVDIKNHEYRESDADDFVVADMRSYGNVKMVLTAGIANGDTLEIYQLAADMGGAQFVFTGENDADIMYNSAQINLHVCNVCELLMERKVNVKVFYSSSACCYPEYNQLDPDNPKCSEESAYPAAPDSEYGWEKLFSERLYLAFAKNKGLQVRIARLHNIFGPYGTWCGGREKAPAALCRKVAMSSSTYGWIEIFGDGKQTRSFLYVDECVEGILRLMRSDFSGPVNIGSEEMVTINRLVEIIAETAGMEIFINHIEGPVGVRGRNSDNKLIREKLEWEPTQPLKEGIQKTYEWISEQI